VTLVANMNHYRAVCTAVREIEDVHGNVNFSFLGDDHVTECCEFAASTHARASPSQAPNVLQVLIRSLENCRDVVRFIPGIERRHNGMKSFFSRRSVWAA
jgi:hypothetical protein